MKKRRLLFLRRNVACEDQGGEDRQGVDANEVVCHVGVSQLTVRRHARLRHDDDGVDQQGPDALHVRRLRPQLRQQDEQTFSYENHYLPTWRARAIRLV